MILENISDKPVFLSTHTTEFYFLSNERKHIHRNDVKLYTENGFTHIGCYAFAVEINKKRYETDQKTLVRKVVTLK